jgi:hypothetical protein
VEKSAVSVGLKLNYRIQFGVPYFGALYISNLAELDLDSLRKVGAGM